MARDGIWRTKVTLNTENMSVDVQIIERETDDVIGERSFPVSEIHDSVKKDTLLYGYSKLLQDRSSEVDVGPNKLDAMDGVAEQLKNGLWAKERKVGATVVSPEVEALARFKGGSVPQAQAALKGYNKEAREKILKHPKIVELAAIIRKERETAPGVDLADMLGEEETEAATA